MRRLKQLVGASLVCWASMGAPAEAAFIGLTSPLGASAEGVETVTLTVSFDPNDSGATNLLGHEFYVHFTGLVPVDGSFTLGSVYDGLAEVDWDTFTGDYFSFGGVCADVVCPYPEDDPESAAHYQSVVALFAPATAVGPGSLFSLTFTPLLGASNWELNLFGEASEFGHAIYWEPEAWAFEPVPFTVVAAGPLTPGSAAILVAADVTRLGGTDPDPDPGTPVPEPSLLLLLGAGLLGLARRIR